MRRRNLASALVLGLCLAMSIGVVGARAQEDPSAGPPRFEIAPGIVAEALAFAEGQDAPALYRLTISSGATYPFTGDASIAVAYVETGPVSLVVEAPIALVLATSSSQTPVTVAPGTSSTLETGDYLMLPPLAGGVIRNEGSVLVSILVASLQPGPDPAESPQTP